MIINANWFKFIFNGNGNFLVKLNIVPDLALFEIL